MHRIMEKLLILHAWISGLILVGTISSITGYLLYRGWAGFSLGLIFGDTPPLEAILLKTPVFDGLFPAVFGTLILVVLSVGMAIPVGIAAGIYMAEYASGKVRYIFSLFFDILAGIPSIVIGLFGFSIAVYLHHHVNRNIYPCLLISAISLAFLVLPYLIRTTQISIESIPENIRVTAIALGASRLQNIIHVLIPEAISGIISGIVLSIGRCAEDTAVIMLTGVAATAGIPKSLLGGYEALPFYIYYISSQYTDTEELTRGFSAAIILVIICLLLFSVAFFIRQRISDNKYYRI